MAQKGVAHFVRVSSQLNLSFILNQITNHLNYRPVVIVYQRQDKTKKNGLNLLAEMKIPILFLSDEKDLLNRIYYFLFRKISLIQKRKILKFIHANRTDLFHFHFGNDAGMFLPVIYKSGLPSVVSFYGDDCTGFTKKYFGLGHYWLKFRVFSKTSRIFAMSSDMKERLTSLGCPEAKIAIHYFGVDTIRFQGHIRSYSHSQEYIQLLMIANLVEKKGHLFLFKVLKMLYEKGITGFRLVVVGSGILEEQLKAFVKENKLTDLISFIPHIDYLSEDFVKLFYDSDIFIHPSVTGSRGEKEGIPGVIIEAMASGLPVISTLHAGIPSIIENGKTGVLVDEWNLPGLLMALESLILNPSKREEIGRAGQDFTIRELNIVNKEKELETLYSTLPG
ncbi:MAG: glycosyltransferase [Bacteroidales bacterium]|jgi:colanic acid/amylovoran biosynthesis glycosyltransferase